MVQVKEGKCLSWLTARQHRQLLVQQQFHLGWLELVLQQRDGKAVFGVLLAQHIGQLQTRQRLAQGLGITRNAVALQQLGQGHQAHTARLRSLIDHDA